MAGFTQGSPREYTPYIPQIPMDAFLKVGMQKEDNYVQAVDKIQSQVNQLGNLDMARPEDKAYLNQKVGDLIGKVNQAAGSDFSDPNVYNQLTSMAATVGNDQTIVAGVQGTLQARNKLKEIQDLKEKHPDQYSEKNAKVAMMDVDAWLYSGAPAGTRLNDRRQLTPWYDVTKEKTDITKDFMSRPDEFTTQTIDKNGVVKQITIKGKSPDALKQFLQANLSDKAKQQLVIDGTYNGMNLSNDVFLKEYQRDKDNQIDDLTEQHKQTSEKYFAAQLSGSSDAAKTHAVELQDINKKIDAINADKQNVDYMKSALTQKADYYGQIYANQKINSMAVTSGYQQNSVEYKSNEATVAYLNRVSQREIENFKQQQENNRAAATIKTENRRIDVEAGKAEEAHQLKLYELGLPSIYNGSTGIYDPNRLDTNNPENSRVSPVQANSNQVVGQSAFHEFLADKQKNIEKYNTDRDNLYNIFSKDQNNQVLLANGSGKDFTHMTESERKQSFYNLLNAAEPIIKSGSTALNIPSYLKEDGTGHNSIKDFLIEHSNTKNEDILRQNKIQIASNKLMEQVSKIGVGDVKIGDKTYTKQDIINYITGQSSPIKAEQVEAGYTKQNSISYPGSNTIGSYASLSNPYGGAVTPLESNNPLQAAVRKVRDSKALQEYYNEFNHSVGQEDLMVSSNYNPENKIQQQHFEQRKNHIWGLINQQQKDILPLVNSNDMEHTIISNLKTGEVTGYFTHKFQGKDVKTEFSVIDKDIIFNNSEDIKLQQQISINNGATAPITVPGLKPFDVVIKAASNDAASKYTLSNGAPSKYYLTLPSGAIIKGPDEGFNSPSAAQDYIRLMGSRVLNQQAVKWYTEQSKNPNFNQLSFEDKTELFKNFITNYDVTKHINTMSNDPYSYTLQGISNQVNQKK